VRETGQNVIGTWWTRYLGIQSSELPLVDGMIRSTSSDDGRIHDPTRHHHIQSIAASTKFSRWRILLEV
jgi:hypothetical protein